MRTVLDYPHRLAGHCGSGALRDLLEFHGLDYGHGPLSEGAAFGLAGGLGFVYIELPEMRPPIYLVGRMANLEEDIAGHLGFGLEKRATDDPDEGWELVKSEVDAGRPPMLWADIGHLDYLRVHMHNTRHDIVVVGYDEAAGVAYVADNDREEIQACSLESLAAARASEAFPGPARHTVFLYDWPESLGDLLPAVRAGVARATEHMRSPSSYEGQAGLAGVERFAFAYGDWPVTFGENLVNALKGLRVFIVKAGTGGAMFRSLHAEFLRDFAGLLGDDGLASAADAYEELTATYVALAGAMEGCADDPLAAHEHARDHVAAVARLEAEGVRRMERWLAGTA